jgi:hypothetical protein
MAKTNNLTDFLKDLADGIRAKKGISGAINPQDFRSEIESIETGENKNQGNFDVMHIDVGSVIGSNCKLYFGTYANNGFDLSSTQKVLEFSDGTKIYGKISQGWNLFIMHNGVEKEIWSTGTFVSGGAYYSPETSPYTIAEGATITYINKNEFAEDCFYLSNLSNAVVTYEKQFYENKLPSLTCYRTEDVVYSGKTYAKLYFGAADGSPLNLPAGATSGNLSFKCYLSVPLIDENTFVVKPASGMSGSPLQSLYFLVDDSSGIVEFGASLPVGGSREIPQNDPYFYFGFMYKGNFVQTGNYMLFKPNMFITL